MHNLLELCIKSKHLQKDVTKVFTHNKLFNIPIWFQIQIWKDINDPPSNLEWSEMFIYCKWVHLLCQFKTGLINAEKDWLSES